MSRLPVLVALLTLTPALTAQGAEPTLYSRLGGYDAIAAFVDEFLGRFDADADLAPYLGGINAASGARIRQHFVDFICAETGGPCLYTGRPMPEAHTGLGIPAEHFERVITHMRDALAHRRVDATAARELLDRMRGLRAQVVAP